MLTFSRAVGSLFLILSAISITTTVRAQDFNFEICGPGAQMPSIVTRMRLLLAQQINPDPRFVPKRPHQWQQRQDAPSTRAPSMPNPRMHEMQTPVPQAEAVEETRLSYWGYKHPSLHARGIPQQMQTAEGGSCCNGITSGECRVTRINTLSKEVMIDGKWCLYSPKIKTVILQDLKDDEEAVVCAGRSDPGLSHCTASAFCIGLRAGG